jgi:hypothetical protein
VQLRSKIHNAITVAAVLTVSIAVSIIAAAAAGGLPAGAVLGEVGMLAIVTVFSMLIWAAIEDGKPVVDPG